MKITKQQLEKLIENKIQKILKEDITVTINQIKKYLDLIKKDQEAKKYIVKKIKDDLIIKYDNNFTLLIKGSSIVGYNIDGSLNFVDIPKNINTYKKLNNDVLLQKYFNQKTPKSINNFVFKSEIELPIKGKEEKINQTINGKKEGYWENYYSGDKLGSKGNYKNDKREGYWEEYYNGKLLTKGNYKNGIKEGYWEWYHDNGKIESKGNYKNGEKEGDWKYYDRNGKIKK